MFGWFKRPDMKKAVAEAADDPHVHLIDARSSAEYSKGHIPGAVLFDATDFTTDLPDKDDPIFIYCHTGMRSERAKHLLQATGYRNVSNLGGIRRFKGELTQGTEA